jgi:hypothetical protein
LIGIEIPASILLPGGRVIKKMLNATVCVLDCTPDEGREWLDALLGESPMSEYPLYRGSGSAVYLELWPEHVMLRDYQGKDEIHVSLPADEDELKYLMRRLAEQVATSRVVYCIRTWSWVKNGVSSEVFWQSFQKTR